jgi:hypothetical protein
LWFTPFISLAFNSCLILLWQSFFCYHIDLILSLSYLLFHRFSSRSLFLFSIIETISLCLISHINRSHFIDEIQISIRSFHLDKKIWRDSFSNQNPNSLAKILKHDPWSRMSPRKSPCINLHSNNHHAPIFKFIISFPSQNDNAIYFHTYD